MKEKMNFKNDTMLCKNLQTGMVVLLTNPKPDYIINASNPMVGSEWECKGVVVVSRDGGTTVEWENGCTNYYTDYELSLVMGSLDRGRCMSIW